MKRNIRLLELAGLLLAGAMLCFALPNPSSPILPVVACSVENCAHTQEAACPALALADITYDAKKTATPVDYYGSQLQNPVVRAAVAALDTYYNPKGIGLPTANLGCVVVTGLPGGLGEQDLEAVRYQVMDVLCIARASYYWLDVNNLRFGLQSDEKQSVLVMDFSDRLLNPYTAWSETEQDRDNARAAIETAIGRMAGETRDRERLRILHDFVLESASYRQENDRAFSFTGVFSEGKAICEGYAKAFQLLARAAGYPCELVVGDAMALDGRMRPHMWNAVKLPDGWYFVDCTWDDLPSKRGMDPYQYFLLNAAQAEALGDHVPNGNINLRYKEGGTAPKDTVLPFRFPPLV